MEQKTKTSIQSEVSLQASNLGNYTERNEEYMKTLTAVTKLNSMLADEEKSIREAENQEKRFILEKQKIEDSKKLEDERLKLEKEKLAHQIKQDEIKNKDFEKIENEKLKLEKERLAHQIKQDEIKNNDFKTLEEAKIEFEKSKLAHQIEQDRMKNEIDKLGIQIQEKNLELNIKKADSEIRIAEINAEAQRRSDKIRLISTVVVTGGGLLLELGAIMLQYSLGIKSLALEYVDNGITPKKTGEAIRSLGDFIKKKH